MKSRANRKPRWTSLPSEASGPVSGRSTPIRVGVAARTIAGAARLRATPAVAAPRLRRVTPMVIDLAGQSVRSLTDVGPLTPLGEGNGYLVRDAERLRRDRGD